MNECEVWLKEENRKDMRQQMKASAVEEDERVLCETSSSQRCGVEEYS